MRKGHIQTINKFSGVGTIIDENDQEIPFLVEDLLQWPINDEQIVFDIVLTAVGLMATDILPLNSIRRDEAIARAIPADLSEPLLETVFIRPNGKI